MALNAPIPDRRHELVLIALDAWDHAVVLRGRACYERSDPFWMPWSWGIGTEDGTRLVAKGGGGGPARWLRYFSPALPDTARELWVFAGPDSERPGRETPVPEHPTVVAPLPDSPVVAQPAAASLDAAAVAPAWTGRWPDVLTGPVRPNDVIAVSARLDEVVGRDLNVLSIERYPAWFFLHLGGSGALTGLPGAGRLLWVAEDDRGGRYEGAVKSSHTELGLSLGGEEGAEGA